MPLALLWDMHPIAAAMLLASLTAETHIVMLHSRSEMKALAHLETRLEFRVLPGAVVDLSPTQVETLRADPRVRVVQKDYQIALLHTTQQDAPWSLDRLDKVFIKLINVYIQ